ncbi:MAG: hypothetical protein ABIW82_01020 [Dokdonella sp.]
MTAARLSFRGLSRIVLDLCRLRGDPQDFPYSPNLLALLVGAGTALDTLVGGVLGEADNTLVRSLLSTLLVLAFCWVALAMRGLRNRYMQTACALLACSVALSLLQLPIALLAGPPPTTVADMSALQAMLGWITLALLLWQVSVNAHIMRHALDASFGLAFALVFSWLVAYWAIDRILFGA